MKQAVQQQELWMVEGKRCSFWCRRRKRRRRRK
jgi:hypothetical protein